MSIKITCCLGCLISYVLLMILLLFLSRKTVTLIERRKETEDNLAIVFFALLSFFMSVVCMSAILYSFGIDKVIELVADPPFFFITVVLFIQFIFSLFVLLFRMDDVFYLFRYGSRQILPGIFLVAILSYLYSLLVSGIM